jgi:hypothetical protein
MRAALGESKDLLSPETLALKSSARESGRGCEGESLK